MGGRNGRKGGRPRKDGQRTPKGRLSQAGKSGRVEPNSRVQAMRHAYRWFQGGKASEHLYDPPGRAWAAGLFDGCGADPAAMRDACREYGSGFWVEYRGSAVVVGKYERSVSGGGQGGSSSTPDPAGRRFEALDDMVTRLGRGSRDALHNLCVDHHWFPDENPAWIDRLIAGRTLEEWKRQKRRDKSVAAPPIASGLPTKADQAKLGLARLALVALVAGTGRDKPKGKDGPSLAELTRPAEFDEACEVPATANVHPDFIDPETGFMREWSAIAEILRGRLADGDNEEQAA